MPLSPYLSLHINKIIIGKENINTYSKNMIKLKLIKKNERAFASKKAILKLYLLRKFKFAFF